MAVNRIILNETSYFGAGARRMLADEFRGRGYGKALLQKLAAIALEQGCGRLEWWCLDWNRPSIDFFRSLGAKPMDEWTVYRIDGDTLTQLGTSL